jgi:hypothetical protein
MADSPGCNVPKPERLWEDLLDVRLLSSSLQPVMSTGVAPVLVNSTNSKLPTFEVELNSVMYTPALAVPAALSPKRHHAAANARGVNRRAIVPRQLD